MKKAFRPLLISLLIVVSLVLGSKLIPSDNSMLFSSKSSIGITKLNEILNYIEDSYVDTVFKDELIEDGIQSLLKDLDPHSFYIPKSKYTEMNESLEGNFEGIGVEFRIITDTIMVITTVQGGPSEKMGILSGDRIVSVDDSIIAGEKLKNSHVIKLLKGPQHSLVKVGIKRKGEVNHLTFNIERDRIPITSVQSYYMVNKATGYIRINRFSKTTYDEFKKASDVLLDKGMTTYIVDLRGNPGGLLNQSIEMANEFLQNDRVIVYTQGKSRPKKVFYADQNGALLNIKLHILQDEGSASASEVFAGAIQDNDRGIIIGRRSFGKGLVQEQVDWPDGSALRLTVARYYTPTGRSIQKPYKNVDNYHLETMERLENGELENADSMHVVDSLKFYTSAGNVVYGGGGIFPDIFIPIDSLNYNEYYNDFYRKGALQNYCFHFIDKDRAALLEKYPKWQSFSKQFQLSEKEFEVFLQFASKNGIERNPKKIALLKDKILTDLKAQFARHLYGDEGYFPILNQTDKMIKTSLNQKN